MKHTFCTHIITSDSHRTKRSERTKVRTKYSGRIKEIGVTSVYPPNKRARTMCVRVWLSERQTDGQAASNNFPYSQLQRQQCAATTVHVLLFTIPILMCGWWILCIRMVLRTAVCSPLVTERFEASSMRRTLWAALINWDRMFRFNAFAQRAAFHFNHLLVVKVSNPLAKAWNTSTLFSTCNSFCSCCCFIGWWCILQAYDLTHQ